MSASTPARSLARTTPTDGRFPAGRRATAVDDPPGPSTSKASEARHIRTVRSNVHSMPSYWVMPAVALISCIIIGIGFIVGIPGGGDKD